MKKSITGDGVPTIFATISTGNGGWARCLRQYECILTVFEAKTKENKKKPKKKADTGDLPQYLP